jgi:hypothetical protein
MLRSVGAGGGQLPPATRWMWKRSHGRTTKAPPDERGGNRYVLPNATAPHLDSTLFGNQRPHWRGPLCSRERTSSARLLKSEKCRPKPTWASDREVHPHQATFEINEAANCGGLTGRRFRRWRSRNLKSGKIGRNISDLGELIFGCGLRKTARRAMLLSPIDAFLAVATLGTAVLIEIGVFILLGMI